MANSFVLPTYITKANIPLPYLTLAGLHFSHGHATQSYNENSDLVPLLAFDGPEDLLARFINPDLPYNDTTKVGQAYFTGDFAINSSIIYFDTNWDDGIFFAARVGISSLTLKNVFAYAVSPSGRCLTENEINDNPTLKAYLEILNEKILQNGRPIQDTVANVSTFTLGWAKNFQDFEHADFVNIALQTGIRIPGFPLTKCIDIECDPITPFGIPVDRRLNLGFPFQADAEIGVLDWLNIGLQAGTILYISNDRVTRLNPTPTHNVILSTDHVLSTIKDHPMVYSSFYFEAEHFIPRMSFLLGLSYVKQYKTTYVPCDTQKYPVNIVNKYTMQPPWSRTDVHFQAQLDCSTPEAKCNLLMALLYTAPITGKSVFKTNRVGGSFVLAVLGSF